MLKASRAKLLSCTYNTKELELGLAICAQDLNCILIPLCQHCHRKVLSPCI